MREFKNLIAFGVLSLAVLTGCQRVVVTTEIFVNKADPTEVLKLESQPALNYNFRERSRDAEWSGVYTLTTDNGTISGTYTYVLNSKGEFRYYIFNPQKGERWTAKLDTRGSLTDEKGSLWRIQHYKKDTKEKVALQIGG